MLIAAKTWKKPKCPSTDEWIKKMWYLYIMEYYSAINKNEIMPFTAIWMDLEIIMLSKPDRGKYTQLVLCAIYLKLSYKSTILQ